MSILKTLAINGKLFRVTPIKVTHSVTLLASAWVGEGNRHYQVVEVEGITLNTKVNLQPTLEQLEEFRNKELTFTTKNENGVVTVYAIGDKPTMDYTMQVTLTEVVRDGNQAIWGDTVDTPAPSGGSGGGVSSWNDLTDKPFGETVETVPVLEETTYDGFEEYDGVYSYAVSPPNYTLSPGETYIVEWNGESFTCTAQDTIMSGVVIVALGNASAFGLSGNNEPFCIVWNQYEVTYASLDNKTSNTVGIYQGGTTIKTIDPKYLPMEAIDARIDAYIEEALGGEF